MSLNVNLSNDGETATISLASKFNFDYVNEFRGCYSDVDAKEFIVDFRNTEYMDSSGLGMLLNMRRHLGDSKANIKLVNCRPQIKKILMISRFETKFTIN